MDRSIWDGGRREAQKSRFSGWNNFWILFCVTYNAVKHVLIPEISYYNFYIFFFQEIDGGASKRKVKCWAVWAKEGKVIEKKRVLKYFVLCVFIVKMNKSHIRKFLLFIFLYKAIWIILWDSYPRGILQVPDG